MIILDDEEEDISDLSIQIILLNQCTQKPLLVITIKE